MNKPLNIIQKIIGKFYYYARAVDNTMLVALGELSTKQTVGVATKQVAEDEGERESLRKSPSEDDVGSSIKSDTDESADPDRETHL